MTRMSRRGPWLPEEDAALVELVRIQGPNNWVRISQQLQHRSPKQCRERYHQNLKPSLNHEPISAVEGEMIEQLVHEMGKRWADIARRLGNRSDNAVKNWWNGSMNRRKRNPMQHNSVSQVGNRLHPVPNIEASRSTFGHHASTQSLHQKHYPTDLCAEKELSMLNTTHTSATMLHASERHSKSNSNSNFSKSRPYQQSSHSRRSPSYPANVTQHGSPKSFPFSHNENSKLAPLRLPALLSYQPEGCSPSRNEKPSKSPCMSEFSYPLSTKAVPSLVSDNHSTHSISPKTFGSPRVSAPPREIGMHSYHNSNGHGSGCDYQNSQRMTTGSYWRHHDTKSSSDSSKISDVSNFAFPLVNYSLSCRGNVYDPVTTSRTDSPKDSRMNVSSLIQ